jgi:dienelactone hydrolase
MTNYTPTAALFAVILLLASCGGGGSGGGDAGPQASAAGPSWDSAAVYLPGAGSTRTTIAALAGQRPSPVLVALHGCNGLGGLPGWGADLAAAGYVVIMPDSLARPDRAGRFTCSGTSTGTGNLDIYDKRIEEAEYAIAKVQGQPWYDGRHLVLLGQSEGGFTVARKAYAGISAAVISGYWCTGAGGASVASVAPTLSVSYTQDPFYFNVPGFSAPSCNGGPGGSKHVVLPGAFHSAFDTADGRREVLDFVRAQAVR